MPDLNQIKQGEQGARPTRAVRQGSVRQSCRAAPWAEGHNIATAMKAVISALAGRAITRAIETSDFDWRLQLAEASHVRTAAAMDMPGRGRYCNPQAKF